MIFFSCAINLAWFGRIPFGINASLPSVMNSFYKGIIGDNTQYQLGYFDIFTGGTITAIALTIWSLFAIRFLPTHNIDSSIIPQGVADKSLETKMPVHQEIIVFVLFITMCVGFLFSSQLGNYMYIIPVACVLLVYYFKIMSLNEIVHSLTSDMIWLVAGMTVMSTALGDSGAAQLLGNAVLAIVGNHPDPFILCLVLGIATMIPANFTSHMGTFAIMSPIAASIALAGGMNPVPLILVVFCTGCAGMAFPSGNTGAMIAFGVGNYNPIETWKFTIPYLAIAVIVSAITIPMFFPLY
jgi:di/tricarboxylate transporter